MLIFSATSEDEKINMVRQMIAAIVYNTEAQVRPKLADFGIDLDEAIRIIRSVVTAHNDAVPFDPKTAAGQFRYIYGTRAMRETWVSKGWAVDSERGIESVFSAELGVKIVYQSVDKACDVNSTPKAISDKGTASKNLVQRSTSAYLFPEMEADEQQAVESAKSKENAQTWYFCVSIDGDEVRAELSLPYSVEDNNFSGFIERVFIVEGGEWGSSGIVELDDDDDKLEIEPIISKK